MNAVNLDEISMGRLIQRIQNSPKAFRALNHCRLEPPPRELMQPDDSSREARVAYYEAQAARHLAEAARLVSKKVRHRQERWRLPPETVKRLRERARRYFSGPPTWKPHQWDGQSCLECGQQKVKARGLCENCYAYLYRYRPRKREGEEE